MPNELNKAIQNLLMNVLSRSNMIFFVIPWLMNAFSFKFIAHSGAAIFDLIGFIQIILESLSTTFNMPCLSFLFLVEVELNP